MTPETDWLARILLAAIVFTAAALVLALLLIPTA